MILNLALLLYAYGMVCLLCVLFITAQELRVMNKVFKPFLDKIKSLPDGPPTEERLQRLLQDLEDLNHYSSVYDNFDRNSSKKFGFRILNVWSMLQEAWWGRFGRAEQYWSQRLNG